MSEFDESADTFAGYRTRLIMPRGAPGFAIATVVFIHGWSDSADTFKPLMRQLSLNPARLVALDLPHFGQAEDLRDGAQLPQFAAFVGDALQHFSRLGPVVAVGQSLGGRVVLMAVATEPKLNNPARVAGVVAVAPAPMVLPAWQRMLVRNSSLAASVSGIEDATSLEGRVAALVTSFRRTCFAAAERIEEAVFADYARHYTGARVSRHIESLRRIGAELELPVDLDALAVPVEIIWGANDRMAPVAGAQDYLKALPGARLHRLEACGHHAHLECVEAVADRIEAILATIQAPSTEPRAP